MAARLRRTSERSNATWLVTLVALVSVATFADLLFGTAYDSGDSGLAKFIATDLDITNWSGMAFLMGLTDS